MNTKLHSTILIGMALCFSIGSNAQKTVISGTVVDAQTNEPIPFANIAFLGAKVGTTSNIEGYYRIETYYASDSMGVSVVGYKPEFRKVKIDREQTFHFLMEPISVGLEEVVISAKEKVYENPAHPILRNILKNKKINDREKLEAYQYETYNKVQFDLNNITEEFTNRKIFKSFDFIFDHIDSTDQKTALPIFMTESLSDFYYRQKPKAEKEVIKATKVSGFENESVSQFLGDMYQNVNVYDNNIQVFGKSFVSPISDAGMFFYRYYLMDSAYVGNKWCYNIMFKPKRKQELTFDGEFWVNDTTYAIKSIEAEIAKDANINFISQLRVKQQYDEVETEVWMLSKDELIIDFNVVKSQMGIYGRKFTSYKNFVINNAKDDKFYSGVENVVLNKDIYGKDEAFWVKARHDSLSTDQKEIYSMITKLKKVPQFRTYVDIITLLVSGYYVKGNFEYGPYSSIISSNPVEGFRLRLGGRTSNDFSKRLMLEAYGAYGFKDKEFKYRGGFQYFLTKQPRQLLTVHYSKDVEQLGQSINAFDQDNLFSSFLRTNPNNKLTMNQQLKASLEREWFYGFSNRIQFTNKRLSPLGALKYEKFSEDNGGLVEVKEINSSEVSFKTRFAYKEKYVSGEFERVSLGTKYPILTVDFSLGIKGALKSNFEYQRLILGYQHWLSFGPLGYVEYRFEGGKTWGDLPYPLLFIHQGNETYFYDDMAFNTMSFFEFISDEYVSGAASWHLEGLFFNRVPLLRKLKWREVAGVKGVIGDLGDGNRDELLIPLNSNALKKPFAETSVGIENILKFLRVDAIWRLTYLENPSITKFGARVSMELNF
ncbi:MAG: carboxypeptidase-like regulatory domain-containing protein [Flavobacteriales bacterium]|nr:carboxypeptidase-like regulatory domain-containing protein [Flavobacteriales bacterium]